MRLCPPITVPASRTARWRPSGPKMRRPSPLPTIVPTRSSYLQRLLWMFMPGR